MFPSRFGKAEDDSTVRSNACRIPQTMEQIQDAEVSELLHRITRIASASVERARVFRLVPGEPRGEPPLRQFILPRSANVLETFDGACEKVIIGWD